LLLGKWRRRLIARSTEWVSGTVFRRFTG